MFYVPISISMIAQSEINYYYNHINEDIYTYLAPTLA